MGEIILHYACGPSTTRRVHMERTGQTIASFEDGRRGPAAKQFGPSLEADKDKGLNGSLEPLQGTQLCRHFGFCPLRPISEPWNSYGDTFVLYQATEFVMTCFSSQRG